MKKLGLIAFLSSLLISCEYKDVPSVFTVGTYKGRLDIINGLVDYVPFNVTLTFAGHRFSFESNPALCQSICNNGAYQIYEQQIEFISDCVSSLGCVEALNGAFQFKVVGRQLEMTQKAGSNTFSYKLILQ